MDCWFEKPLEPRNILPMEKVIAVGFGAAYLSCDGETIWQEDSSMEYSDCWTVSRAEQEATVRPGCDWRIHIVGPLREGHWQRQGAGQWVMYASGQGFA